MNTRIISQYIFLGFFLVAFAASSYAQKPDESVEVITGFQETIGDVKKLDLTPDPPEEPTKQEPLIYDVQSKSLDVTYEAPTIRPVAIGKRKPAKAYPFWAKLGFGTPLRPYADIRYSNLDQSKFGYGIELHHESAKAKRLFQRFSESSATLNGQYAFDKAVLKADVGFDLENRFYYGFNESDTTFVEDDSKQRFLTLRGGIGLSNSKLDDKGFGYSAELDAYRLNDRFDYGETGVLAGLNLYKWIADKHKIHFGVTNHLASSTDTTLNALGLHPNFEFHQKRFKAKIGAGVFLDGSQVQVIPDLEFLVNVAGSQLVAFAGWNGDVAPSSLKKQTQYSPWVRSDIQLRNTTVNAQYLGFRGKVKGVGFELKGEHRFLKNLATYNSDSTDFRKFNVQYDDGRQIKATTALTVQPIKNLTVIGSLDYNIYNLDSLAQAWHLPVFEGKLDATYTYKKLTGRAEIEVRSGRKYLDENNLEQNLNSRFQVNLGASYSITPKISAFAEAYNLTNSKAPDFYRYEQFGITLLGGVIIKL